VGEGGAIDFNQDYDLINFENIIRHHSGIKGVGHSIQTGNEFNKDSISAGIIDNRI
jgi:hypothetical protein